MSRMSYIWPICNYSSWLMHECTGIIIINNCQCVYVCVCVCVCMSVCGLLDYLHDVAALDIREGHCIACG